MNPSRAVLSWIGAGVVLAAAVIVQWRIVLNHDVAWLLVASGRMLHGGSYLTDFFEVNLPLAVAAYVPAEVLHATFTLPIGAATRLWFLFVILLSVVLSLRFVRAERAAFVAAWLVTGLVLLPGYDFSQKEHFIALSALPFLFLMSTDAPAGGRLRVAVSLFAALGFFMKPHYAPLPFLLLGARDGLAGALRSLEFRTLLGAGLAYAVWVLLVYPDWFVVARWLTDLYGAYRADWSDVVTPEVTAVAIALATVTLIARVEPELRRTLRPFLIAGAYSLAAYVLQFKGWRYQFLPCEIIVFSAAGVVLAGLSRHRHARIAAGLLCLAGALHATQLALRAPRTEQMMREPLVQALSGLPAGTPVAALSTAVLPFFPAVSLLDLQWSSRYGVLWPLAGMTASPDLMARYREPFIAAVREDFERYRPVAVVVDERPGQFGLPEGFRILKFLQQDRAFAALWANYEPVISGEGLTVYFVRAPMGS